MNSIRYSPLKTAKVIIATVPQSKYSFAVDSSIITALSNYCHKGINLIANIIHTDSMQQSPPIFETQNMNLLYGRIQIVRKIDRDKNPELTKHAI